MSDIKIPTHEVPLPIIIEARRVGNTTRIVDYIIQKVFTTSRCTVVFSHSKEHEHTYEIIKKRMALEHRGYDISMKAEGPLVAGEQEYTFKLIVK